MTRTWLCFFLVLGTTAACGEDDQDGDDVALQDGGEDAALEDGGDGDASSSNALCPLPQGTTLEHGDAVFIPEGCIVSGEQQPTSEAPAIYTDEASLGGLFAESPGCTNARDLAFASIDFETQRALAWRSTSGTVTEVVNDGNTVHVGFLHPVSGAAPQAGGVIVAIPAGEDNVAIMECQEQCPEEGCPP